MPHLTARLSFHHMVLLGIHLAGPVQPAGGGPLPLGPRHPLGPPLLIGTQTLCIYRTVNMTLEKNAAESQGPSGPPPWVHHKLHINTAWTLRNSTGIWSLSPAVDPRSSTKIRMRDLKHLLEPEQLSTARPTLVLAKAVKYHRPGTATVHTATPHRGSPTLEKADWVLLKAPGRGPLTLYSAPHPLMVPPHQDEVPTLRCLVVHVHVLQSQKLIRALRGIIRSVVTESGAIWGKAWRPYWSLNLRRPQ